MRDSTFSVKKHSKHKTPHHKTIQLTIPVRLRHVPCWPLYTDQYVENSYESNNISGSGIQNVIAETRQKNEKKLFRVVIDWTD